VKLLSEVCEEVGSLAPGLVTDLIAHSRPRCVRLRQTAIGFKPVLVAVQKIPVKGIERAGVVSNPLLRIEAAVAAIV